MTTTTAAPVAPLEDHPAKFSDSIMDTIVDELRTRFVTGLLLDPFAGVGRVHEIADRAGCNAIGVEIEPEWAATHEHTVCGDSTDLRSVLSPIHVGQFAAVVTSPAYGNRFADQYLGSDDEKCRACQGTGNVDPDDRVSDDCPKCEGTGRSKSKRMGYAISLGRKCTPGSGAAMTWGEKYRALHRRVWASCDDMLAPGGLWMVNVSSIIREKSYQGVMEWHLGEIAKRAHIEALVPIDTDRMKHGENAAARVHVEHLIVARKAAR